MNCPGSLAQLGIDGTREKRRAPVDSGLKRVTFTICCMPAPSPLRNHHAPDSCEDSEHWKQHWNHRLRSFLHSATNIMVIKIRKTQARCDFENIPPGTYALAVIHDENMNGKLDTNWLWIPTEGYGFSNDATALLGAPSFSAASFHYDGGNLDLTISLHY